MSPTSLLPGPASGRPRLLRHEWGAPVRFEFKTERQCCRCGIVKVTRRGGDGSFWTEFWRATGAGASDEYEPVPKPVIDGTERTPACRAIEVNQQPTTNAAKEAA